MIYNLFRALTTVLALSLTTFSFTQAWARPTHFKYQLDPELTGREYQRLLADQESKKLLSIDSRELVGLSEEEFSQLDKWIALGARNLAWVDLVNQNRPADKKISFSSEATQTGSPVETPRIYNYSIIAEQWRVLTTLLPKKLKDVLLGEGKLPATIPVTDREFIEWGLQVDKAYSITARYKLMLPNQDYMAQYKAYDVRGYLNLVNFDDLDVILKNWQYLGERTKKYLRTNLRVICMNNEIEIEACEENLSAAESDNQMVEFKNRFWAAAEDNYRSFFDIRQFRSDTLWDIKNNQLVIPFTDPDNDPIKSFLSFNIEEEFSWNGWKLRLDFVNQKSDDTTHIVFEPGVTPHVNRLGGSEITMDANAPLSEYDVQWTIRHEYGHVLGLPDCYFEFYDDEINAFVSYQLDVTNLMCSRRGHFQEIHFNELKRVYGGGK